MGEARTCEVVLIVDDQPDNLAVLSRLLEEVGFRVLAVTSGARAIEAARRGQPDCVLLDVSMPEMDGYAVCEVFQKDDELAEIPIIFLTAHDDVAHKVRAFSSGGRDYVSKPFQPAEVVARVENQLRIRRLERSLRQQTEALEVANAKLQESAIVKSRITATLVHDIRSPLSVIATVLESPLTKEDVADGWTAFESIQSLTNQLMALAKTEEDIPQRSIGPVSLLPIVEDVVKLSRRLARQADVELSLRADVDTVIVQGEREELERVLTNIMSNAIKFTPAGGSIEVRLRTCTGTGVERGLSFASLIVSDTGAGIPPEDLPFVFEAYRQASGGIERGGHGLGLAIVARIVARFEGRIHVRSRLNVGTEVEVLLPLAKVLVR